MKLDDLKEKYEQEKRSTEEHSELLLKSAAELIANAMAWDNVNGMQVQLRSRRRLAQRMGTASFVRLAGHEDGKEVMVFTEEGQSWNIAHLSRNDVEAVTEEVLYELGEGKDRPPFNADGEECGISQQVCDRYLEFIEDEANFRYFCQHALTVQMMRLGKKKAVLKKKDIQKHAKGFVSTEKGYLFSEFEIIGASLAETNAEVSRDPLSYAKDDVAVFDVITPDGKERKAEIGLVDVESVYNAVIRMLEDDEDIES